MQIKDSTTATHNSIKQAACLKIDDFDQMPPFFMSLVSRDNLWAFISSRGSLSAGRESSEKAIFPYVTVDKIHDSYGVTGPRTMIRLANNELWEPFTPHTERAHNLARTLSKSTLGNSICFREQRAQDGLSFSYRWQPAGRFGLARTACLKNHGSHAVQLKILDGIANILPPGLESRLQATRSVLTDAYKQSELQPNSRMAMYSTASGITDRPEPMENLRANCVWSAGLSEAEVTLAIDAPDAMIQGKTAHQRDLSCGQRGAYWLNGEITLQPGQSKEWLIVLDCDLDAAELAMRIDQLDTEDGAALVKQAIDNNDAELAELLASADAFQCGNDPMSEIHHTANVLFNSMRGGIFIKGYSIQGEHLQAHIKDANQTLYESHKAALSDLNGWLDYGECRSRIEELKDLDLLRLFLEYLPLTFSRRHGDPSRPWNKFVIKTHDSDGNPSMAYQGNWRDIFQNWEALCLSYPLFLEHVIAKFLNTSTMDGYNPYRIFDRGFDWEEIDAEDPFSGIGYWGDHQIVYLLRLIKTLRAFEPKVLDKWLDERAFVFANVPYRIKSMEAIFDNPQSTITFDADLSAQLRLQAEEEGSDGALLKTANASIHKANLTEKILIPALVKLSNFVPGGGIWMNTERPEWNDANNALVGYGLSMVTTGHLLRYLEFCREWWSELDHDKQVFLSAPVAEFVGSLLPIFTNRETDPSICTRDDTLRAQVVCELGLSGQRYRDRVYAADFETSKNLPLKTVLDLLEAAERWLRATLDAAKRPDSLMDSYNLLDYSEDRSSMSVSRLYEMLEGQVSGLSAGHLSSSEAVKLVDTMFESPLYVKDRNSFLLYPDRKLPAFMNKGLIDESAVQSSKLLQHMLDIKDSRLVTNDSQGKVRFASSLENKDALDLLLKALSTEETLAELVEQEFSLTHQIYENVFNHRAFTGRSGGMFSFEGLGCIYWHQVSKLLLAVQECFFNEAEKASPDKELLNALGVRYYKVRKGLGFNKTAQQYGAFPSDPYSHTPAHSGAQQPGMTGQVKEEVITRFGELGIRIRAGALHFDPRLLLASEFIHNSRTFKTTLLDGNVANFELKSGELAFTYCQTPFIYIVDSNTGHIRVQINRQDGSQQVSEGSQLPADAYQDVIQRTGHIRCVRITVPERLLFQ